MRVLSSRRDGAASPGRPQPPSVVEKVAAAVTAVVMVVLVAVSYLSMSFLAGIAAIGCLTVWSWYLASRRGHITRWGREEYAAVVGAMLLATTLPSEGRHLPVWMVAVCVALALGCFAVSLTTSWRRRSARLR